VDTGLPSTITVSTIQIAQQLKNLLKQFSDTYRELPLFHEVIKNNINLKALIAALIVLKLKVDIEWDIEICGETDTTLSSGGKIWFQGKPVIGFEWSCTQHIP